MLTVFITSNQIPLHVHAVFCHNNYYIIVFQLHVHCIHLARGMMRMRIPSTIVYTVGMAHYYIYIYKHILLTKIIDARTI